MVLNCTVTNSPTLPEQSSPPAEPSAVRLRIRELMERRTAEYLQVNPMGQVPAIDDNGFLLTESHAILTYIHATRGLPDHWYPSELKARAMVNRYLHWHHTNLRAGEALIFVNVIAPVLGISVPP